ncbi:MAG: 30S ribosomal protein S6 [Candidatus Nealsonbacteria bacterium]|nr:30S ribosomal protein S6 [Candidatus Nealsonbacteria bacterium]
MLEIMKNYEITYLVPSALSDEEQKGAMERVSSLIQEKEGVLKEGEPPVKRILPQQIGQHKEVLSVSLYFYAKPEKIQEIHNALALDKSIVRFMMVTKEAPSALKPIRKRTRDESKKKIDLKDIEQKIEEILK